jgi:hypothetical protein
MDDSHQKQDIPNVKSMIRDVIQEFVNVEHTRSEPAYKAELIEERRRREQLEKRVNELVEENRKSRQVADELDRTTTIRSELQRLGVAKVDLAFRAIKDEIRRAEDGRLVAQNERGEVNLRDYLSEFVNDNPELLPARVPGGSGAGPTHWATSGSAIDIDKIKPGMSAEDLDRVRQEIARVASQAVRGL